MWSEEIAMSVISCSCENLTEYCDVPVGLRELWILDDYLQGQVPAVDRANNRFFEEGAAREDMSSCDCYVVLVGVGPSVDLVKSSTAKWSQASFTFEIYARRKQKVRRIKDYVIHNWIKGICGFRIPGGCASNFEVTGFTDPVLGPKGMRLATVNISLQLTAFRSECVDYSE
jgi:hypothetical protein